MKLNLAKKGRNSLAQVTEKSQRQVWVWAELVERPRGSHLFHSLHLVSLVSSVWAPPTSIRPSSPGKVSAPVPGSIPSSQQPCGLGTLTPILQMGS